MNRPRIGLWLGVLCVPAILFPTLSCPSVFAQQLERRASFETLIKNYTCGHSGRATYIVTNPDQWATVWSMAMSNMYPEPPPPIIDFTSQSVIAVFEGDQPSSDYSIAVKKLIRSGKSLKVVIEEKTPSDECKVLLVITQPVHIVVTERIPDPDRVSFKLRQRVKNCVDQG